MLYICIVKLNDTSMKWNEFIKLIKAKGWRCERSGGRHDVYTHPDKKHPLIIPRHGAAEIKDGLYHRLKKEAGL